MHATAPPANAPLGRLDGARQPIAAATTLALPAGRIRPARQDVEAKARPSRAGVATAADKLRRVASRKCGGRCCERLLSEGSAGGRRMAQASGGRAMDGEPRPRMAVRPPPGRRIADAKKNSRSPGMATTPAAVTILHCDRASTSDISDSRGFDVHYRNGWPLMIPAIIVRYSNILHLR